MHSESSGVYCKISNTFQTGYKTIALFATFTSILPNIFELLYSWKIARKVTGSLVTYIFHVLGFN